MANTFELIASSTVGSGGASSIDFTSIPSTYTDLVLKVSSRVSTSGVVYSGFIVRFNGTSGSSNSKLLFTINGTSAQSGAPASDIIGGQSATASETANVFSNSEVYIPNYAGSANKSVSSDGVNENNATAATLGLNAGLWSNTAAITSIKLVDEFGSTFQQYSTAYLYGVKNA